VPRAPLVLVATSLAAFTATLDNTVVAVALREVQRDLGSGVTGLQGIVTAYTVALAALLLAGGALVDVLGAKRVLLAGLALFAGASAACASAGTVGQLVGWRAVQGAGAALLLPGALAVLAAAYPDPVRRRRAVGIWAAVGGAALVAGPVVGGYLVDDQGWESVFWVNVPLCVLVALVSLLAPPDRTAPRRRLDVLGALLTCAVLGLATYAVVLGGRSGLTAAVVACAVGAILAGLGLYAAERRTPDPLLPGELLRDRRFGGAALGAFAASLGVFVLLVFVSLFLQLVQDHDAQQAGAVLLPLPAALVVTAAMAGRWRAVAVPVLAGLVIAGGGLVVLGVRLRVGTSDAELRLLLGVVGAGLGLTTAPVVTAALASAGAARAGLAAASVTVARELGGGVAVAGLGALAVAQLSRELTTTLTRGGVPAGKQPAVLDALLGARSDEVRRLLLRDVGVEKTLKLGDGLADAATASFLASTQLIVVTAGAVLLLAALVSGWLLRPSDRPV
jgi:DHA2 family methylenomycin A resistance protein-like MFS transporter